MRKQLLQSSCIQECSSEGSFDPEQQLLVVQYLTSEYR